MFFYCFFTKRLASNKTQKPFSFPFHSGWHWYDPVGGYDTLQSKPSNSLTF